jgi:hypothetical protein
MSPTPQQGRQAQLRVAGAQFDRSLASATTRRGRSLESLAEQTVKNGMVHGFVEIDGTGEAMVDVTFPATFLEKPAFTFGFELADNTWPTDGAFPVYSASVITWVTSKRSNDRVYYLGARLGVVIFGVSDMRSILHYIAAGQKFTDPVNNDFSIGAPL